MLFLEVVLMATLAQAPHVHGHGPGGTHGNPEDMQEYMRRLEGPERAEWQKPDEVVAALKLKAGQTACEIGAGPGYFSLRFAKIVGAAGAVFAVDVDSKILEVLRERIQSAGARNVVPVLALPDDPLLPPASCDLILMIDSYHHLDDGVGYLKRLARSLKAGGRLVNIDFHKRELPMGPPPELKVSREDFLKAAQTAGFQLVEEPIFLPHQYFLILKPR